MPEEEEKIQPKRKRRSTKLTPEAERALDIWVDSITPKYSAEEKKKKFTASHKSKKSRPEVIPEGRPFTEEDEELMRDGSIEAAIKLANRDRKADGLPELSEVDIQRIHEANQRYTEKYKDPRWHKEFMQKVMEKAGYQTLPEAEEPSTEEGLTSRRWVQDITQERQDGPKKR